MYLHCLTAKAQNNPSTQTTPTHSPTYISTTFMHAASLCPCKHAFVQRHSQFRDYFYPHTRNANYDARDGDTWINSQCHDYVAYGGPAVWPAYKRHTPWHLLGQNIMFRLKKEKVYEKNRKSTFTCRKRSLYTHLYARKFPLFFLIH